MSLRHTLASLALVAALGSCASTPEPREILFARGVGGRPQLWRMTADGSSARIFTADTLHLGAWSNVPDRSPDGRQVLFAAGESAAQLGIYLAKEDGSDIKRLDPGRLPLAQWPAWSPDGAQVLFDAGHSYADLDLYLMNADGSNLRQLTSDPGSESCGRWSPDGKRIVYLAYSGDTRRLMTFDLERGTSEPTLPQGSDGDCADWSPDGRRIVFSASPDFGSREPGAVSPQASSVFLLDLGANSITQVTHLEGLSFRPRWSRDGSWIAFNSTAPVGTVPMSDAVINGMEIYLIRPDGSDLRRLTNNDVFDGHPVW